MGECKRPAVEKAAASADDRVTRLVGDFPCRPAFELGKTGLVLPATAKGLKDSVV